MIKNKFFAVSATVLLAFSFLMPNISLATSHTLDTVCDPLPEDPEHLLECIEMEGTNPPPPPIEEEDKTVYGPETGTWGMAGAYNPTNDTMLFVAAAAESGVYFEIRNATTRAVIVPKTKINTGDFFAGRPDALYNPETNQFFVTWLDSRDGRNASRVYARIINADGTFAGSDFQTHMLNDVLAPVDITIDLVNDRYIIVAGNPEVMLMIPVSFAGVPGTQIRIDNEPSKWEGMVAVTYNSDVNEYWYVYALGYAGDDTAEEDIRIMAARVHGASFEKIGTPVQLSTQRIGRNGFSLPGIDYSPDDKAAMVTWLERGRDGFPAAIYGRMIYSDFTIGPLFPVLTPDTYAGSEVYVGGDTLRYNPYTGLFNLVAEDNNLATTAVDILAGGTIVDSYECIKQLGGIGNFWPDIISYSKGIYCMTSVDYNTSTFVAYETPLRNRAKVENPPGATYNRPDLSASGLAKLVSQIYLYSLGLSGLLAVGMFVWGGYLVMSARGNGAQATQGKSYIFSALIGMVILFGAYIILNTINSDLTTFGIPDINVLK